jgi:hypothetical protein
LNSDVRDSNDLPLPDRPRPEASEKDDGWDAETKKVRELMDRYEKREGGGGARRRVAEAIETAAVFIEAATPFGGTGPLPDARVPDLSEPPGIERRIDAADDAGAALEKQHREAVEREPPAKPLYADHRDPPDVD